MIESSRKGKEGCTRKEEGCTRKEEGTGKEIACQKEGAGKEKGSRKEESPCEEEIPRQKEDWEKVKSIHRRKEKGLKGKGMPIRYIS